MAGRGFVEVQKVVILPVLPKIVPTVDITPSEDESFDLGTALEHYYPLLEHVFQFLERADLHSASAVSSEWDKAAKRELTKRIAPGYINVWAGQLLVDAQVNFGLKYMNAATCMFTYCPRVIKLVEFIYLHQGPSSVMPFAEYLRTRIVPTGVNFCAIGCTAVPTPSNARTPIYQGLFIPHIPKMRTTMFYFNHVEHDENPQFFKNNDEEVKCLLLFTQQYRMTHVEKLLNGILNKGQHFQSIAMGGGIIKSAKSFKADVPTDRPTISRSRDIFCIGFLQKVDEEAEFNAYSIVIMDEKNPKRFELFEAEIKKFKQTSILRKYGIIFRFCCYAKIEKYKQKEIQSITNHFPNYPLMGLEVDGEIGWNSSKEEKQGKSDGKIHNPPLKKQKAVLPVTLHGWSSALVLATWGKKC